MSADFVPCQPKWSQFDPTDPYWTTEEAERQAARAKAAERRNLAVLVCVCAVALALTALHVLGPLPVGAL